MSYQQHLEQEAEVWGAEAERMAQQLPPDWAHYRHLWHNRLLHAPHIDALLAEITPGMQVLEAGCASGWLTLALAQRGAHATGLDISTKSLAVARQYAASVQDSITGRLTYAPADLNRLTLPAASYDAIVIQGTLHHLVDLPAVVATLHQALKPGGRLWINDEVRDVSGGAALLAAAAMFLLPTHTPYRDKVRGLLRFGTQAPARIKASMAAEGLSPFEGAGRDHDWLTLVQQQFVIERLHWHPAITGYLAHQVALPTALALPVLRLVRALDTALVRLKLLQASGVVVYARKA
ncbi:MAG: class I SAM-dependent methyltransferase [Anaerolineae bacterium]|jgi:2-polyprenyl-3-methyl-5-hydroxy-6-metoxy-1,4-benzoquinol methylase|nr:class I SAM-dependent methyltransferase [Anaerolineae bacterium]